ncbi:hypothetical protein DJ017_17030 [Phenylobacterium soli]|uniref:O-antigen ligase family protein n=1 Tax=Phenylobacterium soli TaxID=2170551 RepID=A0A328AP46_9CAUL|nr:hypothetical protein DJ017_17030 [Phenylobacterium soli]
MATPNRLHASHPRAASAPGRVSASAVVNWPYYAYFAAAAVMALPILQVAVPGAPALRPSSILAALPLVAFAVQPSNWRRPSPLEFRVLVAFGVYIAVFALEFARSIPNLGIFQAIDPTAFPAQRSTYINSYFFLHVMWALPLVYVVWRFRTPADLVRLFGAISIGLVALSLFIIVNVAAHPEVLFSYNRTAMSALSASTFGMHYNEVAEIFVIVGPLLFYLAMTRGIYWICVYAVSLLAIVLLESRTGLLIFLASNAAVLLTTGRVHLILRFAIAMAGILAVVVGGPLLAARATAGLYQGGNSTFDMILNGRASGIWGPLLSEWTSDPGRFWFGAGEYSILTSHNRMIGGIFRVSQAHNAFLEFFLDCGILLSVVGAAVAVMLLFRGWKVARKIHDELYWALFLCVLAFAISCFTGRRFFPHPDAALMFPLIGALINVARLHLGEGHVRETKRAGPAFRATAGRVER